MRALNAALGSICVGNPILGEDLCGEDGVEHCCSKQTVGDAKIRPTWYIQLQSICLSSQH